MGQILVDREVLLGELQTEVQANSKERLGGEGRIDRVEAAIERLTEAQLRSEISAAEHRKETAKLNRTTRHWHTLPKPLMLSVARRAKSKQAKNVMQRPSTSLCYAQDERGSIPLWVRECTNLLWSDLAKSIDQLRQQVGALSEAIGGDIEEIAYIVLHDVLRREFGWQVRPLERTWQNWDTEPEKINVFGTASDPVQPGRTIWIVGEAKHNLTMREVERFSRQVERARQHLNGEMFAVCFCYRARPEVQERIRAAGLRLVFSYGKLQ